MKKTRYFVGINLTCEISIQTGLHIFTVMENNRFETILIKDSTETSCILQHYQAKQN